MQIPRPRLRASIALLAAAGAVALVLASTLPANALTVTGTPTPVTGNTTYFDGLGQPYGGCGMPQANLDSQNFVALNVYNTPGDYTFYPRPIPDAQASKIGMWNNGHNCGRWVQVTVGDFCTGTNDGAPNQAFCRNGSYTPDAYNGATLTMLVADSCGDSNAWCRDDPYHIDLAKPSLNLFARAGVPVGDMFPNHFNNRHMTWQFVPAPNYSGDIQIGFLAGAQVWWPAISVSHLANGIHSVEYLSGSTWVAAPMNSDMGESFIIGGTTAGTNQFQIRVRDSSDALINGGRVYSFTLPASCGSSCPAAYQQVPYTTSGAGPSTGPTVTASPTVSPTGSPTMSPTVGPTVGPTTAPPGGKTCSASYTVTGQWAGGFQGEVAVHNTGTTALTGWRVVWTYANGQTISQLWNGTLTTSGATQTVTNVSFNATVAPAAATTFGFLASWTTANAVPTPTCTAL